MHYALSLQQELVHTDPVHTWPGSVLKTAGLGLALGVCATLVSRDFTSPSPIAVGWCQMAAAPVQASGPSAHPRRLSSH